MRAEFVNPFLLSLMNVMSTMAQLELKPGAPRKKSDDVARGDVSGLIGMVGPQTKGSFSITFDTYTSTVINKLYTEINKIKI